MNWLSVPLDLGADAEVTRSDSYAVRFIANYGVYVGRRLCFHLLGVMHFSVVLVMDYQQTI